MGAAMGNHYGKKFAAIFSLSAIMYSAYVGPVMLVPLVISVPYRLWKDKKDGIIDENYTLREAALEK